MNEFFVSALSFGLAAGLNPGPLGVVVVQQTLAGGLAKGVRASLAPLITDAPIIIAALWFLSRFKSVNELAAVLSSIGGMYLLWLSLKMLRARDISMAESLHSQGSLRLAVKVNLLNPNPYLFWFTVGGSYMVRGTVAESILFAATAIGTLVASKISIALLASRFLPALGGRGYLLTMKALGAALAGFGVVLMVKAHELFSLHG